ncbi:hypothetical protein ACFQE5_23070 [Pseudonocardia hispaniensis]|uniref:Uncharacterized protein n=1 Tax=Pseudonocardia hispaniensis TaxID=904933 RepID=A0ABW1J8C0_9PSEU
MAVKRFLANVAPPVTVSTSGVWNDQAGKVARGLTATPQGTNTSSARAETTATSPWDVALGQWVSDPILQAGTLQGAYTYCRAIQESSSNADLQSRTLIYVMSGDGTTVRGTAANGLATGEWPTTNTAQQINGTLNPVACQVGDRIVVELGYRATNTATTSYTGTIRYGGIDSTDLAPGDTGTAVTTRPAWIRFDDPAVDALFTTPDPGGSRTEPTLRGNTVLATHTTSGSTASVTADATGLGSDPQVGDTIVCWQAMDWDTLADMSGPATVSGTDGWVQQPTADGGTNKTHIRTYTTKVTAAGAKTITTTIGKPGDFHGLAVAVVIDAEAVDDAKGIGAPGPVSDHASPAATASVENVLQLATWVGLTFSAPAPDYTPPAGWTQRAKRINGTVVAMITASRTLADPGAVAAASATWGNPAGSASEGYSSSTVLLRGAAAGGSEHTLTRAGDTSTPRPLRASKSSRLPRPGTADGARPLAVSRVYRLGQPGETTSPRPLARATKTTRPARPGDTAAPRPLDVVKDHPPLGRPATAADTRELARPAKTISLARSGAEDGPRPLTSIKSYLLGRAGDSTATHPLARGSKRTGLARPGETGGARELVLAVIGDLARAADTSAARPLTRASKSTTLARPGAVDGAHPLGPVKSYTLGRPGDTSAPRPVRASRAYTLPRPGDTAASQPLARAAKTTQLTRPVDTSAARPLERAAKSAQLARSGAAASARALAPAKSYTLGRPGETGAARPVGSGVGIDLARAGDQTTPRPLARASKTYVLGRVGELSAARAVSRAAARGIARAGDASAPRALARAVKVYVLGRPGDATAPRPFDVVKGYPALGRPGQLAVARGLGRTRKTGRLGRPRVLERTRPLGAGSRTDLARAGDAAAPRPLGRASKAYVLGRAGETSAARPVRGARSHPPLSRPGDLAVARPVGRARRFPLGRTGDTAAARPVTVDRRIRYPLRAGVPIDQVRRLRAGRPDWQTRAPSPP